MVFVIALIPALFVYWISVKTDSYFWTAAAAALASAVGVATGNPAFVGVDLLCIAIACYISHVQLKSRRKEAKRYAEIELSVEQARRTNEQQAAIRIARLEAHKNIWTQKRTELRAEQEGYQRAANDRSLRDSARARAASKVTEIEALIQQKYPE